MSCSHARVCPLSYAQLFATPWTVAHQTPVSMRVPRQEYWSGLPFPTPVDLPSPGIEPTSPALQEDSLLLSQDGSSRSVRQVIKIQAQMNVQYTL